MDKNVRLMWARLRNRLSVAGSFPVVTLAWDCAGKKGGLRMRLRSRSPCIVDYYSW